MEYKAYCDRMKKERTFRNEEKVKSWLKKEVELAAQGDLEEAIALIEVMEETVTLTKEVVTNIFGPEKSRVDEALRKLSIFHCVIRRTRGYAKTVPFKEMLPKVREELRRYGFE